MDLIINEFVHDIDIYKYFDKEVAFFDIETTGLNRTKNMVYLIGLLYFDKDNNKWIIRQYFADRIDLELNILEKFIQDIEGFEKIITFNGNSFDIPFVEARLKFYGKDFTFNMDKSFDLYRFVRSNKDYLNLPNMKLKTIEEYLGYFREDIYSGYECIEFYFSYLNTRNREFKDRVLLHNYEDLYHMLDVLEILDVVNDKKSIALRGGQKLVLDRIEIRGDMVSIAGDMEGFSQNLVYYGSKYSLVTKDLDRFYLDVEYKLGMVSETEKALYIDLNDFDLSLVSSDKYKLKANIYILMVEKDLMLDNIKNLISQLFEISI